MRKSNQLRIEKGKTKLLWLIDSLGHGGAENLMPRILSRIDSAQFDQRVCTLQIRDGNPIAKDLEDIGIPVDYVPVPRLRNLGNLPRLLTYLNKVKPDIIHTQLEFSETLGCLAAKLLGIPSITTFHVVHDLENEGNAHWRYELNWASLRYFATRILAVSDSVRNNIIEVGRIPAGKAVTMHNGIAVDKFSQAASTSSLSRSDLEIPEEGKVIITVAILREAKGMQYVLEAMPRILEKIPNAYYLIVGDGEFRQELESLSGSLQITDNIRFAGYRTDIPEILSLADIFILPTLGDALPTVLTEAMAAGKPLIASNVGGVPEILQDGINGQLIPPADSSAIAESCINLLSDQSRLEEYARAGRQIAEESFNIDNQVRKLEETYKELIQNAKR